MGFIGTCKLCLHSDVALQRSHYVPAGVYRLCKTADAPGNSSPLLIAKGLLVQTDHQERAYVLCHDCEQRFNKLGEKWIFSNGIQQRMPTFGPFTVDKTTFPLLAKLQQLHPSHFGFGVKVFTGEQVETAAREALTYFAASMFWRGAVYPWLGKDIYPVRLGPYREAFRHYLYGESGFPTKAALAITIREPGMIWKHTHHPLSVRRDGVHTHKFVMPGFIFQMQVGKDLAEWVRDCCFVRGAGKPLMVGSHVEQGIGDTASSLNAYGGNRAAKKR